MLSLPETSNWDWYSYREKCDEYLNCSSFVTKRPSPTRRPVLLLLLLLLLLLSAAATYTTTGDRGSTVVKVLSYKSEGRWFDPRWYH
jgi:hypothetical protein